MNIQITYLDKIVHEMNHYLHQLSFSMDLVLDRQVSILEYQVNARHLQETIRRLASLISLLSSPH